VRSLIYWPTKAKYKVLPLNWCQETAVELCSFVHPILSYLLATSSDRPVSLRYRMAHASWTIPIQTLIGLEIGDDFNLASISAASPGDGPGTALASPTQSHKRNASVAGFDSSPASLESPDLNGDDNGRDGRRRPVKRACNECRQQKVSHHTFTLYNTLGSLHRSRCR
jgi:hypothetical protein